MQSVLSQTFLPYEVFAIDDGSDESHSSKIRYICSQYNVTYIHQENGGLASARNLGIYHSNSPWIALLDNGDQWYPNHIESIASSLEPYIHNSDLALIYSNYHDSGIPRFCNSITGGSPWKYLFKEGPIIPSAVLLNSSILKTHLFDTSFRRAQDTELWCRLLQHKYFFVHDSNLTLSKPYHHSSLSNNVISKYYFLRKIYFKYSPVILLFPMLTLLLYRSTRRLGRLQQINQVWKLMLFPEALILAPFLVFFWFFLICPFKFLRTIKHNFLDFKRHA